MSNPTHHPGILLHALNILLINSMRVIIPIKLIYLYASMPPGVNKYILRLTLMKKGVGGGMNEAKSLVKDNKPRGPNIQYY